uniref:Carboxylesterase n=1 Tax=Opuntia streptacantha TaxID=393608 RepID=A0A7C8ZMU7_OPUST
MPYCTVTGAGDDGLAAEESEIKIFYRTYGHGPIKVLLIIGLAGTHDSWGPQIRGLAGTDNPNDEKSTVDDEDSCNAGGVEVCAFDNRGMGRSSVPTKRSEYT